MDDKDQEGNIAEKELVPEEAEESEPQMNTEEYEEYKRKFKEQFGHSFVDEESEGEEAEEAEEVEEADHKNGQEGEEHDLPVEAEEA